MLGQPICNEGLWPGFYIILTQYWCILRRMCWICCDRVATSFLNIADRALYLLSKTIMVKFFKTMQYTKHLSFNVVIPLLCTGQAFTSNTIALRRVLSGVISFGYVVPSPVCNRVALSPILDASISRYRGLVSL